MRAHACCASKKPQEQEGLRRHCDTFLTKIHTVCDALGKPLEFIITGGKVAAEKLQIAHNLRNLKFKAILADKSYDSNLIVKTIEKQGAEPIIPPKRNRKVQRIYDKGMYKERHKINNLFGFLKHCRRLFARFNKLQSRFTSFLNLIPVLQWLK